MNNLNLKVKKKADFTLSVKKLSDDATIPKYSHPGDAGMNLYSTEDYSLKAGERKMFKLGFSMSFPEGYVCHIWDRSSMAAKYGIKTMGGCVEHTYRGELAVILLNTSDIDHDIKKGDKIAQMVFVPVSTPESVEVNELSETQRGDGGFGSTGR